MTDEINKTRFKDTKCNLPPIKDDESKIKITKEGISPSEFEIVDRSVADPISTTLDVTNENTPKEDNKEGDYDTVEEDPDEKGYETLNFPDGTIEITDKENISQSKKQGLVKGHNHDNAACSFKKRKISDNDKNFESDSFDTDTNNRVSDKSSSSVKTVMSGSPRSDLMLESKSIKPVQEPFVLTLPESDAHQYENYQGSTSDVDNINLADFTTIENTPLPIMRQNVNTNVNSTNKHSNRCSQDSSDSTKSDESYKSADSHISLQENSVAQITSNKEETIIEMDASSIASDVNNVAVLKGSVEVTKVASQPNINLNAKNVTFNLVYNQKN